MGIATLGSTSKLHLSEAALRVDLAAAFRLAAYFDWHESVANHFSAAVSEDGSTFLLNPRWQHFSTIKASDLLLLDANDADVMGVVEAPDPSAWCIHGTVHRTIRNARVMLHCHSPYATALCGLEDPSIKPIDQTTARFYNRHVVDLEYGGMADESQEGDRIAANLVPAIGVQMNQSVAMLMGNHGVSIVGGSVADAFETLYYLERAAKTMILAYSTGQPLNVMPDDVAESTARSWVAYAGAADSHFEHLKCMLDQQDASYRD